MRKNRLLGHSLRLPHRERLPLADYRPAGFLHRLECQARRRRNVLDQELPAQARLRRVARLWKGSRRSLTRRCCGSPFGWTC